MSARKSHESVSKYSASVCVTGSNQMRKKNFVGVIWKCCGMNYVISSISIYSMLLWESI